MQDHLKVVFFYLDAVVSVRILTIIVMIDFVGQGFPFGTIRRSIPKNLNNYHVVSRHLFFHLLTLRRQ
jgi:hypothetical protein